MTKLTTIILGIFICFWSNLATATDINFVIQNNMPTNINFVAQNNLASATTYIKSSSQDVSVNRPLTIVPKIKEKRIDSKASFRRLSTIQLLALTIYGESRNESVEGKIAVGTVIIERYIHRKMDIKSVILEQKAFSCFNSDDKQYERLKNIALHWKSNYNNSRSLRECYKLSKGLVEGTIVGHRLLMENCATYFKTPAAKWRWKGSKNLRLVCKIGGHQFYSETAARIEYVSYNTIFVKSQKEIKNVYT